jgi:hypothetical protein
MGKVIARHTSTDEPVIDEFTIVGERDGQAEEHTFTVSPNVSIGNILGLIKNAGEIASVPYIEKVIRRSCLDGDGVPARWKPVIREGHFTAPNGDHTPVADLDKFTAVEAGSSRRRWVHLIENDDDIDIQAEQFAEAFEFLLSLVAERPTQRSSSSRR